jgi:hypothetical protein
MKKKNRKGAEGEEGFSIKPYLSFRMRLRTEGSTRRFSENS